MKITLFLLLFVTFQAYCGNSYSQNAKVSIPDSQLRVGQIPFSAFAFALRLSTMSTTLP